MPCNLLYVECYTTGILMSWGDMFLLYLLPCSTNVSAMEDFSGGVYIYGAVVCHRVHKL